MSSNSTPPSSAPVPLVLIAGFLGAGKTTFIRRTLPLLAARRLVPHVVINDYRNARIDAQTLEGYAASVAPINGTCVCCDSRDELMETLKQYELPPRSVVLLEANGTADVPELIEILTADRRARRYTLPVPITVIDAKRWQKRYWHNGLEAGQLSAAIGFLITRAEEVPERRLAEVEADLKQRAPRAQPIDAEWLAERLIEMVEHPDRFPPRRFAPPVLGESSAHVHHAQAHHFASMEIPLPARLREEQIEAFLDSLPLEVIRAKGVAYLDGEPLRAVLFQKIEGRERPAFVDLPKPSRFEPLMVLIGAQCPREAIMESAARHLGLEPDRRTPVHSVPL